MVRVPTAPTLQSLSLHAPVSNARKVTKEHQVAQMRNTSHKITMENIPMLLHFPADNDVSRAIVSSRHSSVVAMFVAYLIGTTVAIRKHAYLSKLAIVAKSYK